ncbi:MAG: RdgB/HAM1 family non-canonical purine NTP pyrophosphatase [Pyrinomonadaceae bacterium]
MELLIATSNRGKVREIEELLSATAVRFRSLLDFPGVIEVEETGSTFEENAILKAVGYALQTGLWALADDSGLEIAALGNAPGVLSARYGGDGTGFDQKMSMLLGEMELAHDHRRDARFVCSMALANPDGDIAIKAEGVCEGKIADEPRGNGGFGYDPMFIPARHEKTFGQLSNDIKREISHRALASRIIIRYLHAFTAV